MLNAQYTAVALRGGTPGTFVPYGAPTQGIPSVPGAHG
jgi:hypothetical protein